MPTFLVVGATGMVGSRIVMGLAQRGHVVHALSRKPKPNRFFDRRVVSFAGDATDPAGYAKALEGIAATFLLWPAFSAERAPGVIDALAQRSGHIVFLSAHGVPDDPDAPSALFHAAIERLIRKSGASWTFLRPTGFASNTLGWAHQIRNGDSVRWPYGMARRSLVHEDDVAAVAIEALGNPDHFGKNHALSGPEQLTQIEQVERIGKAIGRPLNYVDLDPASAREELLASWGSAEFVDAALHGWAAMVDTPEPVTTAVADIIGRPALSFTRWVNDHVADFVAPRPADN